MTGPCLCGDPECGRCFPNPRPVFHVQDLADVLAAWAYRRGTVRETNLDALDAADVAILIEAAVQAVQVKIRRGKRPTAQVEAALDSRLAQRIFDLIQDDATEQDVAGAER